MYGEELIGMRKNYIRLGVILLLFIICLSTFRMIWMGFFQNEIQPDIQNGVLDIQSWDLGDKETLVLDGEWKFYPSQFIMEEVSRAGSESEILDVPEGWNDILNSSFGYGTYRLQIKVNPDIDQNYGLYIPSIRSSSEVYVNGRKLSSSGEIASDEEQYTAKNLPQNVVFTANEEGNIDIVIQAANYKDIRSSGIIRSVKFGTEQAISRGTQISSYFQISIIVIFLIHAVYTFILYLIGNRDKYLFYFSILMLSIIVTSLLSNGDKLIHQFLNISYDFDFRLANTLLLVGCYALLQCTNHLELPYWRRVFPFYKWSIFGVMGITLFLSIPQILFLFPVYYLFAFIVIVVTFCSIARMYRQNPATNLFLVLSFFAVVHHYIWDIGWREQSIYLTFYPFDLIVAVVCYITVWFKGYFQMHEETKELADSLQRMNKEKDQFLANTSHEFRNPLNSILLLSKAVMDREETVLSERSVSELNTVLNVGKRMNLLLTDLLEARNLNRTKPRLNKQVISLEPIATGVLDLLQLSSDMKQLEMINKIPKEFPAVYADENRVTQILFNLVGNAVKYTSKGGVTISAEKKEKYAEVHVTDTGIGISGEMQKRLFLPYEQDNATSGMQEGGFGLGLSITKQLVELHGGQIWVSSEDAEKTTFTFTLELASSQEAVQLPVQTVRTAAKSEDKVESGLPQLNDGRASAVLLVDDNPASLLALNSILSEDMYDTVPVSNAKQALEEMKKREWDIVVSDIMMPEISGYKLTGMIRERYSLTELPVLLLTGGNADIQAAFVAGANDYITKPVEPVELKARMDSLITMKRVAEQQLQFETAWLQAQIQPHFLFNTLNSILALSEWDVEEMRKLLNELSNFLRSKFRFQQMKDLIPLDEELNIVRSYLYIEQVRFGEALQVKWELDGYQGISVPFLSIQPLVENAVQHGIRNRQGKGTVVIRFKKDTACSKAFITVEDDGAGIETADIANILQGNSGSESGVGILNVEKRLHQHYGKGLMIDSSLNKGTSVSFEIDI
ncbi:hypothetical protein OSO01_42260 [Oceanobacillus sojae]|uniref:histidine kinase n=2 Tax=Bacillaceae TaxID=186817 RepID=A0A511ZPY5_9BACI|nr:hypothetical protein OSO01_42260 [Oceanobacillus sojae]